MKERTTLPSAGYRLLVVPSRASPFLWPSASSFMSSPDMRGLALRVRVRVMVITDYLIWH